MEWLCVLLLDTRPVSYINCILNPTNDNAVCAVFSYYPIYTFIPPQQTPAVIKEQYLSPIITKIFQ